MNKEEENWVKTARDKGYSILQIQNHLKTVNYPEEKINEFSQFYVGLTNLPQIKQETYQPPQEPVKAKKKFSFFRIFKTKVAKIIIFVFVGIPIYLYLLTISPRTTGAMLGLGILFLIFWGMYVAIKRRMNKEMEVIQHVEYPREEPTEPKEISSGTGRGIRESEERERSKPEGERTGRSNRKPKRRNKLQVESPSQVGRGEISDRKPDRKPDREHEEVGETTEQSISDVPEVEPID